MSTNFKDQKPKPDPKYQDNLVAKFINHLMRRGKKQKARKLVYESFKILKDKVKEDPVEVFRKALDNTRPNVEVRPIRVGGATYQVPHQLKGKRKDSLAMRWIIDFARKGKGKGMEKKLAEELLDAYNNKGKAVKKKINIHKMAKANKAFSYLAK